MNTIGIRTYTVQQGDTLWQLAKRFNTSVYAIAALNPGIDINSLSIGQKLFIWPGFGNYPIEIVLREYASGISKAQDTLSKLMRQLWVQHVIWTILTIRGLIFDAPDVTNVIERLLQNPIDFANALRQYYGDDEANQFAALLKDHLVIAAELVNASKAGNSDAAADAERRWYANADAIAAFLANINPFWDYNQWKTMLFDHLRLVKQIAVDLLEKNYPAAIKDIDQYENQALLMADMMTTGIAQQFRNIFI